jgi:hypothetical protein
MRTIVCDLRGVAADCVTVDALARIHLAARRAGVELDVLHASEELKELLVFAGLDGVLGGLDETTSVPSGCAKPS